MPPTQADYLPPTAKGAPMEPPRRLAPTARPSSGPSTRGSISATKVPQAKKPSNGSLFNDDAAPGSLLGRLLSLEPSDDAEPVSPVAAVFSDDEEFAQGEEYDDEEHPPSPRFSDGEEDYVDEKHQSPPKRPSPPNHPPPRNHPPPPSFRDERTGRGGIFGEQASLLSSIEGEGKGTEEIDTMDVPEHLMESVDAIMGNNELKRALSAGAPQTKDVAKRRRLDLEDEAEAAAYDHPLVSVLLERWKATNDRSMKFVLRKAEDEELEQLHRMKFTVKEGEQRSVSEQVYGWVMKHRERHLPSNGTFDAVYSFRKRWGLEGKSDSMLRPLPYAKLRQVLAGYDGSQKLADLLADVESDLPQLDGGEDEEALAVGPGCMTLGRHGRMEMIDPFADALVVGDANLTFSLELAKHRKSLCHSGVTVCTTFEKLQTLKERYGEIGTTIKQLHALDAEIMHDVDCTRLVNYPRFQDVEGKFGAVYYNFPHAGIVSGFADGHPFVRWRHANLMHLFFRSLRCFVKVGGRVVVASNSRATGVRYSDIIRAATSNEFVHAETFPFLEWQLHDYLRSYGDRRDKNKRIAGGQVYAAQNAQNDMVYTFTYAPSGQELEPPDVAYPPSKADLLMSNEGKLPNMGTKEREKRVEELYKLFLSYVEGIHVG